MEGLVKFREAFAEYSENYVVIGGAACDITMTNTVVRPRATHDIDMIVIVEKMCIRDSKSTVLHFSAASGNFLHE